MPGPPGEIRINFLCWGHHQRKGLRSPETHVFCTQRRHQLLLEFLPLGGQNLNYNTESRKIQHQPSDRTLGLVYNDWGVLKGQRARGIQAAVGSQAKVHQTQMPLLGRPSDRPAPGTPVICTSLAHSVWLYIFDSHPYVLCHRYLTCLSVRS